MSTTSEPLDLFWFLPTSGDGPLSRLRRRATARPISAICARSPMAADRLGFGGVLLPTGNSCLDGWIVGAGARAATERLQIPAWRCAPASSTPALAARQAAALDRISQRPPAAQHRDRRRPDELAGDGVSARPRRALRADRRIPDHLARPARRRAVDFDGKHLTATRRPARPFRQRAAAASAALVRRLVASRHRGRRRACRYLPDLGRAAGAGGREARRGARRAPRRGRHAALRHARCT